jgi:hypothetical protein
MKNWDAFIIVSTFMLAIALFAGDKIEVENIFYNLKAGETLVVMFKTLIVALMGIISLAIMILVLLLDVAVSLLMRMEFPILQFFYNTIYLDYFRGWYWDAHSGSHLLMACVTLFALALINSYLGPVYREKTFVYHKTKENNYINH